jgi:hypothetical protein
VTHSATVSRSAVLGRSFRKNFPAAIRGKGVHIWDADGNQYLDLAGSAAVNFIGHGVPEISAAMAEQAAKLEFVHSSQFTSPVAEEYAEALLAFAGEHFRDGAVYFTCGGSESIETAMKLARHYQSKSDSPVAIRSSVVSRAITARPSVRCPSRATSDAAKSIFPWCASSHTLACRIVTAVPSIAAMAAAIAACNTPPNLNTLSKAPKARLRRSFSSPSVAPRSAR